MKMFNGSSISINSRIITFKKIEISDLELTDIDSKNKYEQSKNDYFNSLLGTNTTKLKDFRGVYVFVVNNNFILSNDFFSEVKLFFKDGDEYKETKYSIASEISSDYPTDGNLQKGMIFYVGERRDALLDRVREHLTSGTYNGTKSLKLGFKTRNKVKDYLDCYIGIVPNDIETTEVENNIRKAFGSYFGEK